ncbi:twin-arginine translocase subunit TatA [Lysobacteraceae bacterium NML75-0749]|nr:twin-arginine translocase subunit TatA [Xanthomonadaceae bacterium NML03-0222]PJK03243.1 twin-arginine translocase subunit TatA [Xanthomonadaceae bacterium NML75-0749]PJK03820.1 twin-arginine translocase subunit TatA [Xanthomonadaceae bacterium NML71-0210]PJK04473.1 twin-arginine translocase subunit TatA [Xanthomonadaceae bacterium NML91-0268]
MMVGWRELLILLVIVLVVFGTTRLTRGMRDLGKGVREFKKGMREPDEPQALEDARSKAVSATAQSHEDNHQHKS